MTTRTFSCDCEFCQPTLANSTRALLAHLDDPAVQALFPKSGGGGRQVELEELQARRKTHLAFVDGLTPGDEVEVAQAQTLLADLTVIKALAAIPLENAAQVEATLHFGRALREGDNLVDGLLDILDEGPTDQFSQFTDRQASLERDFTLASTVLKPFTKSDDELLPLGGLFDLVGELEDLDLDLDHQLGNWPAPIAGGPFASYFPSPLSAVPFGELLNGNGDEILIDPRILEEVENQLPEDAPEGLAETLASTIEEISSHLGLTPDSIHVNVVEGDAVNISDLLNHPFGKSGTPGSDDQIDS
jgi:hypothetical protein